MKQFAQSLALYEVFLACFKLRYIEFFNSAFFFTTEKTLYLEVHDGERHKSRHQHQYGTVSISIRHFYHI